MFMTADSANKRDATSNNKLIYLNIKFYRLPGAELAKTDMNRNMATRRTLLCYRATATIRYSFNSGWCSSVRTGVAVMSATTGIHQRTLGWMLCEQRPVCPHAVEHSCRT
jgi:hypothetical protein